MRRSGKWIHGGTLAFALVVGAAALGACAPFQAYSPIEGRPSFCDFVRSRVADDTMPIELAEKYYPECGPYEETP